MIFIRQKDNYNTRYELQKYNLLKSEFHKNEMTYKNVTFTS